jgi:AcrR family transcriptional regulator
MTETEKAAYHHGDLRASLLDATLALLAEGQEPSLRAVARRAGVSPMAPYRHYPDKEALLTAVALRGIEALHSAVSAADRAAGAGQGVVAQGLAYVRFAVEHPVLFRLMFGPMRPRASDAICTASQGVKDVLLHRLAVEAPGHAGPERVIGCWALIHGLAMLVIDGLLDQTDPDPLAGMVERTVLAMLQAGPACAAGSPV